MSASSRTVLKAFFETGDMPTEAQFADLIDSFVSMVSDGQLVGSETGLTGVYPQSQSTAYQLTKKINNMTGGTTYSAVKLPQAIPGASITIINSHTSLHTIYPFLGDELDDNGINVGQTINDESTWTYVCAEAGHWYQSAVELW